MKFVSRTPDSGVNVSKRHPLREAVELVAGVAIVGVLVLLALSALAEFLILRIPPEYEARYFGQGWVARLASEDQDSAATIRLQKLTDRIASHWPGRPYPLRVGITDNPEPNAFALPGGTILVTRGLLESAETENELAFVLGHEIGHFRNRDHLRSLGRQVTVALAIAVLSGSSVSGSSNVFGLGQAMAERSFNRDQESAADEFGLRALYAEYGHVQGADDFFGRLPRDDLMSGGQPGRYFATHPISEDRIEALDELAETRGWATTGPLKPLTLRLDQEAGRLDQEAGRPDQGARPHP